MKTYSSITLLLLIACVSTGKIKVSNQGSELGKFPFCNPDDIALTANGPALRKIGGTWLQKTEQGAISSATMLELKTTGEDKYVFEMTSVGRLKVDTMMVTLFQESINKLSGTAVVSGDEILLHISKGSPQTKSAETEADLDRGRYEQEHSMNFRMGRIKMKMLAEVNQIATVSSCNIISQNTAGTGEWDSGIKDDTVFNADFSQYTTRREVNDHFEVFPEHSRRSLMTIEGPAEVGVLFKAIDEILPKKQKQLVFSGTVFQINKAANTVIIYHPTNLSKLNIGQGLEIKSRRTGAQMATVTVDRLNYTNAIVSVKSGSIASIDMADLVLGYK